MIYNVTINDKVYEVEVMRGKANLLSVNAAAAVVAAPIAAPATPAAPAAVADLTPATTPAIKADARVAAGETAIEAPLPGTVVAVKVSVGAKVKKGDVLMVIEAMKMENDVTSTVDGVVTNIFTSKGTTVQTRETLMAIK